MGKVKWQELKPGEMLVKEGKQLRRFVWEERYQ